LASWAHFGSVCPHLSNHHSINVFVLNILIIALGAFLASSESQDADVECFVSEDEMTPVDDGGCECLVRGYECSACVLTMRLMKSPRRRTRLNTMYSKHSLYSMPFSVRSSQII
jgi:hypothetical protein